MATLPVDYVRPDLDFLLERIVEDVQLTPTQYKNAVEKYRAIGTWLEAPGSNLARFSPILIHPQGSMALQTTVRPIKQLEYDLDIVCQVRASALSPMQLYEELFVRLAQSGVYRPLLTRLKRCVRVNYAGDFHLDVIPAERDPDRPDPCVRVPDRKLRDWTPSNPRGFIAWFTARAKQLQVEKHALPMPPQTNTDDKPLLALAVQVIKRRRDVKFGGADSAPRSVVLTTLAGRFYRGEESIIGSIEAILERTLVAVHAVAPNRLEVVNPTNPGERFSDAFTDASYEAFVGFVAEFLGEVRELQATHGHPRLHRQLAAMLGEEQASRALTKYAEVLSARRPSTLKYGPAAGLAIVSNRADATRPVRPNTFHGDGLS